MARVQTLYDVRPRRWLWGLSSGTWDILQKPFSRWSDDMWWPALNGQHLRIATVTQLLASYDPDAIVETGTFRGASTDFFARFGKPVFSVEVSVRHQSVARARLWRRRDVTLVIGEGTEFLRRFAAERGTARPFIYLDAHWGEELPLRTELDIIWAGWEDALVVIDDFRVPHDPGYAYDTYVQGAIDLEYCAPPSDVAVCYPSLPAAAETGFRRGTAYMAKGDQALAALQAGIDAQLLTRSRQLDSRQPAHG